MAEWSRFRQHSDFPLSMQLFPEPNDPGLAPFTQAFMRVMFAHNKLERRVAELAQVITLTFGFGETVALAWSAKDRSKKFRKLCEQHGDKHDGGLPEADDIATLLDEAYDLYNERNWLVHGVWWGFDTHTGVLNVHSVRFRDDEPPGREFTVEQIQQVGEALLDVERTLYGLQTMIEERMPSGLSGYLPLSF